MRPLVQIGGTGARCRATDLLQGLRIVSEALGCFHPRWGTWREHAILHLDNQKAGRGKACVWTIRTKARRLCPADPWQGYRQKMRVVFREAAWPKSFLGGHSMSDSIPLEK